MTEYTISSEIAHMSGPEALPRRNGELAFDAPWQGRAFALAVAVAQQREVGWDRFRGHLAAEIGEHPDASYWDSWVHALERLVDEVTDGITPH